MNRIICNVLIYVRKMSNHKTISSGVIIALRTLRLSQSRITPAFIRFKILREYIYQLNKIDTINTFDRLPVDFVQHP